MAETVAPGLPPHWRAGRNGPFRIAQFVIAGRAEPERFALPAIQDGHNSLDARIKFGHDSEVIVS